MQRFGIGILGIVVLYFPLAAAVFAALVQQRVLSRDQQRRKRLFPAVLLGILWALPSLIVLQRINLAANWWSFHPTGPAVAGMPLELYIGWVILWGAVPVLAFPALDLPEVILIFGAADLWLMPFLNPLLDLHMGPHGPHWLIGEAVSLALILAPAYCLARWTLDNSHLKLRAVLQVALSGLLFLFMLPEIAFALRPISGATSVWQPLIALPHPLLIAALQIIAIAALPGVSAVQEFALRGSGTPIPYDPPQRLVTSGIYRYCASPMQISCGVVLFLWALILRNPWLILAAAIATIYSAGIAHWDEDRDLSARFGSAWQDYRAAVPNWRLRWRPYHATPTARLYISATCGQCSLLRQWIEAHHSLGLELIDAETLPQGSIRRLRYDPANGTLSEEGLLAIARALEHINLFWAWCGMILRLPILHQIVQVALDLSGFGPRTIPGTCPATPSNSQSTESGSSPSSAA
jgi:protein-S-isoprenylcysteine O-methyltransferase Ste14